MGSIQKVLTYLYPCRTAQSFCCNLPLSLRMVFHTAKALLTARQQARLMLVEPADLGKMFAGSQLEEDLGGKRPVMQTFFPYQLNPGPFHVDGDADAGQSEAPRVHEAFTQQGLYGKMWDPRLDAEGNSYVETTPAAQSIFTACGLSLPDPPPVLDPISFGTSFTTVVTGTPDPSVTYLSVCNSSVQTRLKPSRRGWMGWLSSWLCCKFAFFQPLQRMWSWMLACIVGLFHPGAYIAKCLNNQRCSLTPENNDLRYYTRAGCR
eukprot:2249809-Amphidinium_carterae.1